MAHSNWMIPNSSEKITPAQNTDKKAGSAARIKASFAAVMAKEQNAVDTQKAAAEVKSGPASQKAAATARTRPMVARLPDSVGMPLNSNTVLAGRTPSDMMRMRAFNQAQADLRRTRALDGLIQAPGNNASSLDIARSMGAATNLRTLAAANNGAGFALQSTDFIHTNNNVARSVRSRRKSRSTEDMGIGKLSARFESGGEGISAIGYDRNGGTSYGKYQIASRVGSMGSFLSFLDEEAPDLAKRLRRSGPANTGSRRGAMPNEWREIAREQPERFEQLQEAFIHKSHYKPALEAIQQRTGLNMDSLSAAMREVIWSTAVQHGPAGAARIFAQADNMSGKASDASYERKLINNVYTLRAGQFGSSSSQVRDAVRSRFRQERQLALNMLEGTSKATLA